MSFKLDRTLLAWSILTANISAQVRHVPGNQKKPSKIGGVLENLFVQQQQQDSGYDETSTDDDHLLVELNWTQLLGVDELGSIRVDLVASNSLDLLMEDLTPYGFQYRSNFGRMVSGTIPVSSLGHVAESDQLLLARPIFPKNHAGSILSEAVEAHRVDIVQNQYALDGEGIKIGVLSDSYDLLDGATTDIESGDLPSEDNIFILQEFSGASASDEGRAMMQLIHDIAPGAQLAFRTAFEGEADFAAGILELAEAGCDVIVDDVFYFAEPVFQDGIIAQAVDEVASMGIPYFSAAGNMGRQSYESPFVDSNEVGEYLGTTLHNFEPSRSSFLSDTLQAVYFANTDLARVVLQWDEPFASASPSSIGAQSDLDIYFYVQGSTTPIAFSEDSNIGGDPVELVFIDVSDILATLGRSDDDGLILNMAIQLSGGAPPEMMKVIVLDGRSSGAFLDNPTNSGASYGHARASGGAGVGAVFFEATPEIGGLDRPVPEGFTSAGGADIFFDADGDRLAQPEVRYQPRISGIDGVSNTFFGAFSDNADYPHPLFFGTSAAAPNVAAIAALMLQENPSLSPSQIYRILEQTAIDMEDPLVPGIPSAEVGYDFTTGYGLVDAEAAIEKVLSLGEDVSLGPGPRVRVQSISSDGKKSRGKKKIAPSPRKRTGPIRRRRKDTTR